MISLWVEADISVLFSKICFSRKRRLALKQRPVYRGDIGGRTDTPQFDDDDDDHGTE